MGGGGFEPPKQDAADLQSVPFGHSGNHPFQNNIMSWQNRIIAQAFFVRNYFFYVGLSNFYAWYVTYMGILLIFLLSYP